MKRFLMTLSVVAIVSTGILSGPARGQTPSSPGVAEPNGKVNPDALRELLTKGLKATRKDEVEYIDAVVLRVVKNRLPLSLVLASFKYARNRRPSYPFPYFVYSVETLAKRNQKK